MIDINKKYRTRDGQEARIYATDGEHGELVHGAVNHSQHGWQSMIWFANGNYLDDEESDFDLIEVRSRHKRTVWVNVYPEQIHGWFNTREEAQEFARRNLFVEKTVGDTDYLQWQDKRIACIKVELDFEEGEGL